MSTTEEEKALNVETLLADVRKELVFARAAGPSSETEARWVIYLERVEGLTQDWIDTVAAIAEEEREEREDRGPNFRYEMYSRRGNDACEALVVDLIARAASGYVTRRSLEAERQEGQQKIAETYPEVNDTEPDGQICHELNERLCKPNMWAEYGRWTG